MTIFKRWLNLFKQTTTNKVYICLTDNNTLVLYSRLNTLFILVKKKRLKCTFHPYVSKSCNFGRL